MNNQYGDICIIIAIPMLTVIVGAAAGGVVLLLCLLLSCVLGCWCYKSKKGEFLCALDCRIANCEDFFIHSQKLKNERKTAEEDCLGRTCERLQSHS